MKAAIYYQYGDVDVLSVIDRPEPSPGPGEVLVKVMVSGVNPTDWKSRQGTTSSGALPASGVVPHQDGAGRIILVGDGVDPSRVGERVWLWECAYQRADGTAQEFVAIDEQHAVALNDAASYSLGASVGIPAITAHRCLSIADPSLDTLRRGSLSGKTILVTGGAGAVGHAAIELGRWSGASIATTVSSAEKAELATLAGAQLVVNYRSEDVVEKVRHFAPDGVDLIVDVNVIDNIAVDLDVLAPGGAIAAYASGPRDVTVPVRVAMTANVRLQFVLVYTIPFGAKLAGVHAVSAAIDDGALRVGEEAGLRLHRFSLDQIRFAHDLAEHNAVGKVLVDVAEDGEPLTAR